MTDVSRDTVTVADSDHDGETVFVCVRYDGYHEHANHVAVTETVDDALAALEHHVEEMALERGLRGWGHYMTDQGDVLQRCRLAIEEVPTFERGDGHD